MGSYDAQPGAGSQWGTLAEWPQRVLGLLIDAGIGVAAWVIVIIVATILGKIATALGLLVLLAGYAGILGYNVWLAIQVGKTGASPGMRVIGLKCIGKETGRPIGAGMGVARWLAHFVDGAICGVGYLFPLWDAEKQTLADKIIGTHVITAPKQSFSLAPPAGAA